MCWMKHASDVASGSSKAARAKGAPTLLLRCLLVRSARDTSKGRGRIPFKADVSGYVKLELTLEHTASCSPVALNRICVWVCTPRLSQSLIASSTLSRGPTGLKHKPPPAWNLGNSTWFFSSPFRKLRPDVRLWAFRWGR